MNEEEEEKRKGNKTGQRKGKEKRQEGNRDGICIAKLHTNLSLSVYHGGKFDLKIEFYIRYIIRRGSLLKMSCV